MAIKKNIVSFISLKPSKYELAIWKRDQSMCVMNRVFEHCGFHLVTRSYRFTNISVEMWIAPQEGDSCHKKQLRFHLVFRFLRTSYEIAIHMALKTSYIVRSFWDRKMNERNGEWRDSCHFCWTFWYRLSVIFWRFSDFKLSKKRVKLLDRFQKILLKVKLTLYASLQDLQAIFQPDSRPYEIRFHLYRIRNFPL